jgi:hypothetical protein
MKGRPIEKIPKKKHPILMGVEGLNLGLLSDQNIKL